MNWFEELFINEAKAALEHHSGKNNSGEAEDLYAIEDGIITGTISGDYTNDRVSMIRSNAFYYCSNLTTANFPVCTRIGSSAFAYCSNLTTANFPVCTSIGNNAFQRCHNLSSVTFAGSSIPYLANSNAFYSTPYAGYSQSFSGTPYIYVPASLVESYKTATNWTYFSSYFSAIEDLDTA